MDLTTTHHACQGLYCCECDDTSYSQVLKTGGEVEIGPPRGWKVPSRPAKPDPETQGQGWGIYHFIQGCGKMMMKMDGGASTTAGKEESIELVYRISERDEWEELQKKGETFGGDLDRSTGCIHLSKLDQVKDTLQRFFRGREGLFLLQIDASKLGEGLVYEAVDDYNCFPHFYGPSRSFASLPLDAVIKAEKLELQGGEPSCSLLNK